MCRTSSGGFSAGAPSRTRAAHRRAPRRRLRRRGEWSRLKRCDDETLIGARVLDRMVDRKNRNQPGDVEQTRDRAVGGDQAKGAAPFGGAAVRADQHAQARRVEKLELREI